MPELTNEDILKGIDFPHNTWRKKDKKDAPVCRDRIIGCIKRLRDVQLPIDEIKTMLSDLYWDAFVEHELQVKESTGKTVKEFFTAKATAELEMKP